MADETMTGSKVEVTVDPNAEAKKKSIIKYVIIFLVLVGGIFLLKKYVFK
jgi:hypothetical protein